MAVDYLHPDIFSATRAPEFHVLRFAAPSELSRRLAGCRWHQEAMLAEVVGAVLAAHSGSSGPFYGECGDV